MTLRYRIAIAKARSQVALLPLEAGPLRANVVVCALLVLCGCHSDATFLAADAATKALADRMVRGEYEVIYLDSTKEVGEPDFVSFFRSTASQFGSCRLGRLLTRDLYVSPTGTLVNLSYEANCDKGRALERVSWLDEHGRYLLKELHVNPILPSP